VLSNDALFVWLILKAVHRKSLGTLVPRTNVEYACIQQISCYVFLYIHAVVRHVTLFVWVHYYKRTIEKKEERK
jgi:hypothetical protein